MKSLILLLLMTASFGLHAQDLRPWESGNRMRDFSTDGCTLFFDGKPWSAPKEWLHCCLAHDMTYWSGGERDERKDADYELASCVARETNISFAALVRWAVRVGGIPSKAPWSWGYGWSSNIGYRTHSQESRRQIARRLATVYQAFMVAKRKYLDSEQVDYVADAYEDEISYFRDVLSSRERDQLQRLVERLRRN